MYNFNNITTDNKEEEKIDHIISHSKYSVNAKNKLRMSVLLRSYLFSSAVVETGTALVWPPWINF